jgi:hypothetical protein
MQHDVAERQASSGTTLRLCAPCANRTPAWRRSFEVLFEGARGRAALATDVDGGSRGASELEGEALGLVPPSRVLLLGPAHFPLCEIGAALVGQTKHVTELRVHTASALPLAQHSQLLRENLSYVVFVVDMADRSSLELFWDSSAQVRPATLQRCGVALVYGADDASTYAFLLSELLQATTQRDVQMLFLSAPRSGTGVDAAAQAGAMRLASLFKGDAVGVAARPAQTLLRIRALQHTI